MTWGEVNKYITDKLAKGITNIDDYRPAGYMHIDDIVKIIPADNRMWPTVPGGIRYWLKDGDSIIYVPKAENIKNSEAATCCSVPMDARDVPAKPVKSKEPRFGMGYEYYDWVCPTCGKFLAYEPNIDGIPRRCQNCGQRLMKGNIGD